MTDQRQEQQERFREAVDRKNDEAERRSQENQPDGVEPVGGVRGDQENLYEHGRPQDTMSPRDKNSGHGKKTADKWNQ